MDYQCIAFVKILSNVSAVCLGP